MKRKDVSGILFNIQHFSVHDGPGIRTLVFFKGCPLRCQWCANPESWQMAPSPILQPSACLGCGACVQACPTGAISMSISPHHPGQPSGTPRIDVTTCNACGQCAKACWAGAITMEGIRTTVEEVMREVRKDEAFYRNSGGGLTLSGGEVLLQPEFAYALLKTAQEEGIHTAVETTGFADWSSLQRLLEATNLFLYDVKHHDSERHLAVTGVPNVRPLENLARLLHAGANTIVRIPVIPGVNDQPSDAVAFGHLLAKLDVKTVHLLPFHQMGKHKYALHGLAYAFEETKGLTEEEVAPYAHLLEKTMAQTGHPAEIRIGG